MNSLHPKGLWWRKPWRKLCRAGSLCWHGKRFADCWKGIYISLAKSLIFFSLCKSVYRDSNRSCESRKALLPASSSPPRGRCRGSCRSQRHRLLRRLRTAWGCAGSKWNFLGKTPVCIALPPRGQQASSASAKASSSPVPSSSFLEMTF